MAWLCGALLLAASVITYGVHKENNEAKIGMLLTNSGQCKPNANVRGDSRYGATTLVATSDAAYAVE